MIKEHLEKTAGEKKKRGQQVSGAEERYRGTRESWMDRDKYGVAALGTTIDVSQGTQLTCTLYVLKVT